MCESLIRKGGPPAVVLIFSGLFISDAFAQSGRTLRGVVLDSLGEGIAEARVSLHSPTLSRETTTDGKGQFEFPNLSTGEFELLAMAKGFDGKTIKRTVVSDRDPEQVRIVLEPGPISSCCDETMPRVRKRFTLKLRIGDSQYYEEPVDEVPFVAENVVYLFAGDSFGVSLMGTDSEAASVIYQPYSKWSDVDLSYMQEQKGDRYVMVLSVWNRGNRAVCFDAFISGPGEKTLAETRSIAAGPHVSAVDSWPQPIVELVLKNFRRARGTLDQHNSCPTNSQ